jgi:D-hydroxyproline dehydrogenase subunit gamma
MPERFEIRVDGRALPAEAGWSVAAALWNAGVAAFRDSVTGAPRGPLCAMGTCFECRVSVDGRPLVRACLEPCRPGMEVRTRG